ncbi:hypothetical protein CR513_37863, partial [Mucuna pruriens]
MAYIKRNSNPHPKSVPFIIQVSARPVYSNNTVPWRYPTTTPPTIEENSIPKVTNTVERRRVTRSGRVFILEGLRNRDPPPTRKDKVAKATKKIVMEEEVHEFLKMIRHSEYGILDQLHKTPARYHKTSPLNNLGASSTISLQVVTSHFSKTRGLGGRSES